MVEQPLMKIAKEETGMPIVSELMSISYLDEFMDAVDVIQIGARNMWELEDCVKNLELKLSQTEIEYLRLQKDDY